MSKPNASSEPVWLKACGTSACLEVAHDFDGSAYLRNTNVPGVVVEATADEWRAFLEAVHRGEIA